MRVDRIETSAKVLSKISWSGLMAGVGALATFYDALAHQVSVFGI